jgi:putative flippase GtrA
MEIIRFSIVVLIGFVVDLSIAWGVLRLLKIPIWLAALIGFLVAAIVNYKLHEIWTFRSAARRLSRTRPLRYIIGLIITLTSRCGSVLALSINNEKAHPMTVLVISSGISFCIQYLVSRYFVFDKYDHPED